MKFTLIRNLICGVVLLGAASNALAQEDPALFLGRGNARVARAQAYPILLAGDGPYVFAGDHMSYISGWQEGAVRSAHVAIADVAKRMAG